MSEHHCRKCRYFGEGDWSQCEDCERLDHIDALEKSREDLLLRIAALESLVRAADRMRGGGSAALDMTKEWHGGLCSCRKCKVRDELGLSINDYDTQRAAVGEIGEE